MRLTTRMDGEGSIKVNTRIALLASLSDSLSAELGFFLGLSRVTLNSPL
jgi:hypothetical protein